MKIGKLIKLDEHENIKLKYGTVDFINLKSIFLEMSSWVEPINNIDIEKIIYNSKKQIKDRIRKNNSEFFKKESIVDVDIKTNSVKCGKRSFMNIEITLFTEKHFDIRTNKIKTLIKELLYDIIKNDLTNKNLYNFHKCKIN